MMEPLTITLSATGTVLAVLLVNRLERRRRRQKLWPKPRGVKRNKCRALFGGEPVDFKQPVSLDTENPFWNQEQVAEYQERVL
ncbi:hypothetical protein B0A55_01682 [Friedmanniomyces simplex]|uniref:Uncharacterized protein n=1 Tax=Friedmanniomyces simplex TaxID=329884 RepID=A0A4U0XZ01_9PEZI|nr:hypothetical protein B0A55_01682 [Friedmanniomyces simplex]